MPYTEPGEDRWADKLSFNQAMVIFTDTAKELFEKVPELRAFNFVGRWKDQDVVKIGDGSHAVSGDQPRRHRGADRPAPRPRLPRAGDRITAPTSRVDKANTQRMAAIYKKMLGQLKGHAWVSPTLK